MTEDPLSTALVDDVGRAPGPTTLGHAPASATGDATAVETGGHPPGTPGPYRVRPRLRRLVFARAPRCEWPGCGVRASRCDVEHDTAHPDGPTCACNLGPMCRRHHQVKQQGWTKVRGVCSAVSFTGPCGRTWRSPGQHPAPSAARHVPAPVPCDPDGPFDSLSPSQVERELWLLDPTSERWDDAAGLDLRVRDVDPDDGEPLDTVAERLRSGGTTWTLDLDDPYAWLSELRDEESARSA